MVISEWLSGLVRRYFGGSKLDYSLVVSDQHPTEDALKTGVIHIVSFEGHQKWAYLRCPCPQHDVIRLNLSKAKRPQWTVRVNGQGAPEVSPSIWQLDGCYSHFWIRNGKVVWAKGTGTRPSKRILDTLA